MELLLEILGPTLGVLLTILVPAGIAALVRVFQKAGIEIEAKHREALQSALSAAAALALARAGAKGVVPSIAVNYVKDSVPDAVAKFGLDDNRIRELIVPKVIEKEIATASVVETAEVPINPNDPTTKALTAFIGETTKKV